MVRRDFLVQWRDKWEFVFRVAMLPFILILVCLPGILITFDRVVAGRNAKRQP